ncbi:Aspartate aminotransferase [Fasciola gigantica]|uniref:Aspartate aminotransferase n=1 Tax=Fasciola gigantica TaxID=46835 RepID=A0A504YL02_FASGI|nr:Aspartate aminotransferase [Fasciola gigantica]
MGSQFLQVKEAPPVEVFLLSEECKADFDEHKVNLTVGAYRTNEGMPWVLPCVRSVELSMAADEKLNKEYLPITGMDSLVLSGIKLLLGVDNPLISSKKADGCQALGGTGALYLALQFLVRVMKCTVVYVSDPTWPNHRGISSLVGLEVRTYKYWDTEARGLCFTGMVKDLKEAPEGAVVILHACAHNPTGMDLDKSQWTEIAALIKERKLFTLFDIAYQGFASGDLDRDAWAVRLFASQEMELLVAQSFSKNFGLYNERVGNLIFITKDPEITAHVKSQVKCLVRQTWSNPPQHGGRVVATILNSPALYQEWKSDVNIMAQRVLQMRQLLYEKLRELGTPGTWDHIIKQIGMFSFTGLTKAQAEFMRSAHHIYLMNDGRINMCGLTTHNIDYVAHGIDDTLRKIPN